MIVSDISKSTNRLLFRNLSFQIDKGILLLSGPSGCGKSTLIRILEGRIRPDSGKVEGIGNDFAYAGQEPSLFYNDSLRKNLSYFSLDEKEKKRAEELSALFDFSSLMDKKLLTLSGGERRKAELIAALCRDRKVYFLDEPFASLDGEGKKKLASEMERLRKEALIVLVNHDEFSLPAKCDVEVLFLGEGRTEVIGKTDPGKNDDSELRKGRRLFLPLLRSYARDNPFLVFLDSLLLLAMTIFLIFGCSFINTKSDYENDIISLEADPFSYQRYIARNKASLSPEAFTMGDSRLEIILTSEEKLDRLFIVETSTITSPNLWTVKNDSVKTLYLWDNISIKPSKTPSISNEEMDFLLANYRDQGSLSGIDAVLFLPEADMETLLLSGTASWRWGDEEFLPLPGLSYDGVKWRVSEEREERFELVPDDAFSLSLPGWKNDSVTLYDATGSRLLLETDATDSHSDKIVLSIGQYKDILLHISRPGLSNYALSFSREDYRRLGRDFNLEPLDVIPCSSSAGQTSGLLFLSLSGGSLFLLLLFLLLTGKVRRKWLLSASALFGNLGRKGREPFRILIGTSIVFCLALFAFGLLFYPLVFIPFANRANTLAMYPTPLSGYFYYSQQPMNDYYDGIKDFLAFNTFEPVFLVLLLALALFIGLSAFVLGRKERR